VFERFTKSAIEVILVAQEESKLLQHDYVGAEQMLLGVLAVGKSQECVIRLSKRVDVAEVARSEIEKLIGMGSSTPTSEISFNDGAKCVLEGAWDVARKYGNSCIGEEHIFLSLLERMNPNLSQSLDTLEINVHELQEELIASLPSPDRLRVISDETKEQEIEKLERLIDAWRNRAQMARQEERDDLVKIALEQKAILERRLKEVESES
jgi:ATP-dependent Clp protease ATP-binding subunit ClpA